MLTKYRPMHTMIDNFFDQARLACIPEDGAIITRSRMVTEQFKVEYKDDGTIVYNPITEEENDPK